MNKNIYKKLFNKIKNYFYREPKYDTIKEALYEIFDINIIAEFYESIKNKLNKSEKEFLIELIHQRETLLEREFKLDIKYQDFYNDIILKLPLCHDILGKLHLLYIFSNFINREQLISELNILLEAFKEQELYRRVYLVLWYSDTYFIDYNLQNEFNKYRMLVKLVGADIEK